MDHNEFRPDYEVPMVDSVPASEIGVVQVPPPPKSSQRAPAPREHKRSRSRSTGHRPRSRSRGHSKGRKPSKSRDRTTGRKRSVSRPRSRDRRPRRSRSRSRRANRNTGRRGPPRGGQGRRRRSPRRQGNGTPRSPPNGTRANTTPRANATRVQQRPTASFASQRGPSLNDPATVSIGYTVSVPGASVLKQLMSPSPVGAAATPEDFEKAVQSLAQARELLVAKASEGRIQREKQEKELRKEFAQRNTKLRQDILRQDLQQITDNVEIEAKMAMLKQGQPPALVDALWAASDRIVPK